MLRFGYPEFFHLYWLVPVLIIFFVWSFRRRKKLLKKVGDEKLVEQLVRSVSRRKQLWKTVLILISFIVLVFALADPQIGTKLEQVKRSGVDIFVALDVSKSMLAEDVPPNRLEKAKHEVSTFIDRLEGDRVGLICFSGIAFVQCPLTLDYSAARLFLNDIDTDVIPQPGTAISRAIDVAMKSFVAQEFKHKVLVLITDGEDHEGNPLEKAKEAAREGIIIYTIGIGSPQGAPIPEYDAYGNRVGYKKDRDGQIVTTKLDVLTLEKIAFETGGKYYISSTGESELDKIYHEISAMEEKELSSRQFTQFEDRFQIFLIIALIFLIIETLLGERRKIKQLEQKSLTV
ncbi:MAG: VWA domain-containing protein [Calditrichaeota bacterium]|nr:VWA domain-containing protein [Calditrichota bacterium]RQW02151.1 MAG: VWA domain-containing protein [Calditrichota bacterium]